MKLCDGISAVSAEGREKEGSFYLGASLFEGQHSYEAYLGVEKVPLVEELADAYAAQGGLAIVILADRAQAFMSQLAPSRSAFYILLWRMWMVSRKVSGTRISGSSGCRSYLSLVHSHAKYPLRPHCETKIPCEQDIRTFLEKIKNKSHYPY